MTLCFPYKKQGRAQFIALALMALLLKGLFVPSASAQANDFAEYELKAGFLYNFFLFIKWPENAFASEKSPFVLAVIGDAKKGAVIKKTLHGEAIDSHPLEIVIAPTVAGLNKAHMVFFIDPKKETAAYTQMLTQFKTKPIITVGESRSFILQGGDINFVIQKKKIRFEINPQAARKAGLKISSRLLKLSITVPQSQLNNQKQRASSIQHYGIL